MSVKRFVRRNWRGNSRNIRLTLLVKYGETQGPIHRRYRFILEQNGYKIWKTGYWLNFYTHSLLNYQNKCMLGESFGFKNKRVYFGYKYRQMNRI